MEFNHDLREKDPSGLFDWYPLKEWDRVRLALPIEVDGNLLRVVDAPYWQFQDGPPWLVEVLCKNWRYRLNERYLKASEARSAKLANTDNVTKWVESTRELAEDLRRVHGDRIADTLLFACAEASDTVGWLGRRIANPPSRPGTVFDMLVTIDQWAWDQYRAACHDTLGADFSGIPGWDAGRTVLLSGSIMALAEQGKEAISAEGFAQRVRRLEAQILPGQADALVADVVCSLRNGPYDRYGLLPDEKSSSENPRE